MDRPSGRVGVYGGYQPWAKRASIDEIPPGQQGLDLTLRQRVPGFHRGFAGHHVEDFVEQLFIVQVEQFLFAALEQLADEVAGVELFEEGRKALHGDAVRAERCDVDAETREHRLDVFKHRDLARRRGEDFRDQ